MPAFFRALLPALLRKLPPCLLLASCLALTSPAQAAPATLLVFGDSLSAGYGIAQDAAWPALLNRRLHEKGLDYTVVNASISGETTSGGLARIDEALARHAPRVVVIALGSNDGLRGLPVATIRENLVAMIERAQKRGARVLLVGQRLPPNYGAYATRFGELFAEVAKERKTAFVAFLLEGIALRRELFQSDNLHPTAAAQAVLLDNVWKGLSPLLK